MRNFFLSTGLIISILLFNGIETQNTKGKNGEIASVGWVDDDTCEIEPTDDYVQSIKGIVDGDELVLSVSARFAGAVDSITWRGKEFINVFDHGRQISYAWQMDGHGECLNPTEPGSASDLFDLSSTSQLLEVCRPQPNLLSTKTIPAYWLAPGETGFCDGATSEAVNDTLVADHLFAKTIEIGYAGIENVIAFTAEISLPEYYDRLHLEVPTGYMTYEFTNYWRFNPVTGELEKPESLQVLEPWSFVHTSTLPPILATEDGEYAMGAYTAENVITYEILRYEVENLADFTNKWNIIIHEVPAPAGTYTYQSFVIVGTLDQVIEGMNKIFELHPTDFYPPEGYVDIANCDVIEGWAWDAKTPDQPIEIEVRNVNSDGSETTLFTQTADQYRSDLAIALGDNGNHGFSIDTSDIVHSGDPHTLRFYGLNSNADLAPSILLPGEQMVTCSQFSSPPTDEDETSPEEITPDSTQTSSNGAETKNNSSVNLPCFAGAFPLLIGVVFWIENKNRSINTNKK